MDSVFAQTLPLIAGAAYAASALWSKRASVEGGGVWRVTFLTNWGQALIFSPLIFTETGALGLEEWWRILVTSLIYFLGQVIVFAGLHYGEVSVLTPVMGVKVLVVAVMAVLFKNETLPAQWWSAALIAVVAAALLGSGAVGDRRRLVAGVLGGLGAAVAFSGVDVLFQSWGGAIGVWRFTALVMLAMCVWSLALLPRIEGSAWKLPRASMAAFLPSLLMNVVQMGLMAYSVVKLKGAAWANLLYSSRGLWSVLLVWAAGPAFGNSERDSGGRVMLRRLLGSALLLVAIVLVLR